MTSLPSKLKWVSAAFSRLTQIMDGEKTIGEMKGEPFSSDVKAWLNDTQLRFDVYGFLNKQINVHDVTDAVIATIELHLGRKATLHLNGETYIFKKNGFREWSLLHDLPDTDQDPEMVHYTTIRNFFTKEGELTFPDQSPDSEILLLTGLFLRHYFIRRQAKKAAIIAATNASSLLFLY